MKRLESLPPELAAAARIPPWDSLDVRGAAGHSIASMSQIPSESAFLYVTASSPQEAEKIASMLVQERWVACANILPAIQSIYWWEGSVHRDQEVALILKTRRDLVGQVVQRVQQLHSYECPCVVALPIVDGNPAFLQWISAQTQQA